MEKDNMKRLAALLIVVLFAAVPTLANQWLKQSTAAAVSFGPFKDKTDGITNLTGLVSALDNATTGIQCSKNGLGFAVRHASVTASTYDKYGSYLVTLDATDTGTLGRLRVMYDDPTTCLPVWRDYMVVPANVYDSTISGTAVLATNASQLGGQTVTAAAPITANANVGTTQPINFWGTGATAYAKVDVEGWLAATAGALGTSSDMATATQTGMTAQGYTTTRATYIDNINNTNLANIVVTDGAVVATGLSSGLALQTGTTQTTGTVRSLTLSSDFPNTSGAYLPGTILTFTKATSGKTYAGKIRSYVAGKTYAVVTMYDAFPETPTAGDAVSIWPFIWTAMPF
jgi:hypothetical protein